jgi:predicted nucleic acid-binding protein
MILVDTSVLIHFFKGVNSEGCKKFTLLRRKPRLRALTHYGVQARVLDRG